MNREEQAILAAYENGTIRSMAEEAARRNEFGFKQGWTVEQHEEWMINKAMSLASEITAKSQPKQPRVYNTGLGYYGTAKDAAKGFDGIE